MQFQERQKIRKKVYSKPMLIGLLVLLVLLSKALVNIYTKYKETIVAEKSALQRLDELQQRQEVLQSDITNLQSDEGLEAELRKKFNVAHFGEQMIVVVLDEKEEVGVETGFWTRFMSKIKSWF